jgi:hypothetical protein
LQNQKNTEVVVGVSGILIGAFTLLIPSGVVQQLRLPEIVGAISPFLPKLASDASMVRLAGEGYVDRYHLSWFLSAIAFGCFATWL